MNKDHLLLTVKSLLYIYQINHRELNLYCTSNLYKTDKIVMATNSLVPSNEVILNFANTEEIPTFLRNWNINKKRKFTPKLSSNSPAKRQRRSGPDNHR